MAVTVVTRLVQSLLKLNPLVMLVTRAIIRLMTYKGRVSSDMDITYMRGQGRTSILHKLPGGLIPREKGGWSPLVTMVTVTPYYTTPTRVKA